MPLNPRQTKEQASDSRSEPLRKRRGSGPAKETTQGKARNPIKVILVDDHRMFRDGLRALLEHEADLALAGEAEDGRTAVALARQVHPNVAVMDVTMPNLNGIDATRQMLSEAPGVAVLGLSMHTDRRFVTRMLRAGALGYLFKASAFDELVRAIRAVAAGHCYVSPDAAERVVKDYLNRVPPRKRPSALSPREREVLQLVAEGHSTRETANALCVSVKTIETHRAQIMAKLGVHSIAEITKYAIREGLTSLDA